MLPKKNPTAHSRRLSVLVDGLTAVSCGSTGQSTRQGEIPHDEDFLASVIQSGTY